jgi:uncharacterized membrane protein YeaQ/YmgE (transglycosylase-associated protein family)
MNIILFLIIGALAGWLAGKIMKGKGFGFLGNLVVGIIGAIVGGFVFDILHISGYGLIGSLVTAVVGAVILLWAVGRVAKK